MLILVAINAFRVGDRRSKVLGLVALPARHDGVFAQQRELGLAVIEASAKLRRLPAGCRMALLAVPRQGPTVRVLVAASAVFVESKAPILDLLPKRDDRFVALGAIHIFVLARERIPAPVVREAWRLLPRL
jgi:hypothetical protein